MWGACPVAALSNYQTYALALLTSLTSLDTLLVAPETRAAAQATYLKKQMYYNMRARSCRRAAGHLARLAAAGLQVGGDGGGLWWLCWWRGRLLVVTM
jgi:hypothetical protein